MYDYRKMSKEEKIQVLLGRKSLGYPLHAPPHIRYTEGDFLITAACYEHRRIFDTPEELNWLTEQLLTVFTTAKWPCIAWVVLPNHYHALLRLPGLESASEIIRKAHSSISTAINGRQRARGRQVWYRFADKLMTSERHLLATINYIHNNPKKHQYVNEMGEWPWSSYHDYLNKFGEAYMMNLWGLYPVYDYGAKWDIY